MIAVAPLQMSAGQNGVVLSAPNIKRTNDTDELVKVSSTDTTAGYLEDKIIEIDAWLSLTNNNIGANEFLALSHVGPVNTPSTALGQSGMKANDTPDSTAVDLTATSNAMSVWVLCSAYQPGTDEDFKLFPRKLSWDELGHAWQISGEAAAITITVGGGGVDTDEKVAVASGATPGYWEDIVASIWNATPQFSLAVTPIVYWELNGANEAISYLWWPDDPNYADDRPQLYGHDSNALIVHWTDSFTATGSNYVEFTFYTRPAYDTTNKKYIMFARTLKFDKKGHLYSITVETDPTDLIDLVNCTTV
jgi:hypothetical protein